MTKKILAACLLLSCCAGKLSAQGGTWASKPPMPAPRQSLAVGAVKGVLYAIGGCAASCTVLNNESYDPSSATWRERAPIPNSRQQGFNSLGSGVINGIVYVVGDRNGTFYSMALLAYDPASNTWTEKAPPLVQRSGVSGAAANGLLYVLGGAFFNNGSTIYPPDLEAYDPLSDSWTTKAQLPTPRAGVGVAMLNGKLFAVGGSVGSMILPTVEAYDPQTDSWTTKAPLPTARTNPSVSVINGILYAVGGTDGTSVLTTVEAYDPVSDMWSAKAPLPIATLSAGSGVVGGVLHVFGGSNSYGISSTTFAFTPDSDNDSAFSLLNGGNTFNGNQAVSGTITANGFVGSGSGLTGVNAAAFAGLPASSFARTDIGNSFNGNQTVSGTLTANGGSSSTGLAGSSFSGTAVIGTSGGFDGVLGSGGHFGLRGDGGLAGVFGNGQVGVIGTGDTGVTASGRTTGLDATGSLFGISVTLSGSGQQASFGAAGSFNVSNTGKLLSGKNNGTEVFSVANNGALTIGAGTPILKHLSATFSTAFSPLKPSTCSALTFTLTGASDGDSIVLGVPNAMMAIAGIPAYSAWVSSTNTVTIRACNLDPATNQKTGATGTIRVDVWKH